MKEQEKKQKTVQIGKRKIERWQIIAVALAIYDFAAVCGAYFLALFFRFDGVYSSIPEQYMNPYYRVIFPFAAGSVVIFLLFRMYNSMWRFASYTEFVRTLLGSLTASVLHSFLINWIEGPMPLSYYFLGAGFQFVLLIIARFAFRFIQILKHAHEPLKEGSKRIMLIGAGDAAQMILRDIARADEINDKVVCIIDDNPNKWHRYMEGIPSVGGRDDILTSVEKYKVDEIFLAIPSASVQQKRELLAICGETNCILKQLPGMYPLKICWDGIRCGQI